MKHYVLWDIDHTVIGVDSFRYLLAQTLRKELWRLVLFIILQPIFWLLVFLRVERTIIKSLALWLLTVGKSPRQVLAWCQNHGKNLVRFVFPEVQEALRTWHNQGVTVVFVSASVGAWLKPLIESIDPHPDKLLIATKVQRKWGGFVLKGKNCYGQEKIQRLYQRLGKNLCVKAAYSDHPSDLPLLSLAEEPHVVVRKKKFLKFFQKHLGNKLIKHDWSLKIKTCGKKIFL